MEPFTHLLLSVAAARAGLDRLTRLALPIAIVAGLAADLDWLAALAGPRGFLVWHRTATHSLVGTVAIALLAATIFAFATRKHAAPVQFLPAFIVGLFAASLHVAFDVTQSYGVKLLWPFNERWFAIDSLSGFDMWIMFLLLLGILLPMLFHLVSEEIGEQKKSRSAMTCALLALFFACIYTGGRYILHMRALDVLNSRLYRGQTPSALGAFPDSPSPFHWAGVVVTEDAWLRVDVPVAFAPFDPFSAKVYFRPPPSAALTAARATPTATLFLSFARFPRATVEQNDGGYHVEISDMRFEIGAPAGKSMTAVIDLDPQARVLHEELDFGDLLPR